MGFFDTVYNLEGNNIEISGTNFEGTTIVSLIKTKQNADAYTGFVGITARNLLQSPEDEPMEYSRQITFNTEQEQTIRFAVPFQAPELLIILRNDNEELLVTFKPE